ncbi:MAG: ATP-binding protein [Anditalea sp.]
MNKTKINISWSGGKDSALALWMLQIDEQYEVVGLHTTFGEQTRRVGMHGIHECMIEAQAASIGLPLDKIYYPASGDNHAYEKAIRDYLEELEGKGVKHIAYGDILLEDLKKYREDKLAENGFGGIFPLWKRDTRVLSGEFIRQGFKTKICAADKDKIVEYWIGKDYSLEFLNELSPDVDPCGENGEFHSFCYDGPIFNSPLNIYCKEVVQQSYDQKREDRSRGKKYYWFAELDLVPFSPWPEKGLG